MVLQRTDWGEIKWLDEEQEVVSLQGMQVGVVTVFPGAHQARHVHYDEQVLYVVQGQAISWIDGEERSLRAGDFLHLKEGIVHEVYNIGNMPFEHLLISNPIVRDTSDSFSHMGQLPQTMGEKETDTVPQSDSIGNSQGQEIAPDMIYIAIEAIRTQFLETLHYGYAIFDSVGNLIVQSQYFPEYCVKCCAPVNNLGVCPCMRQLKSDEWGQKTHFHCVNGMEVYHYPIYFRGKVLGYIQSGYIKHSGKTDGTAEKSNGKSMENVYDVPESVVNGIKSLLYRIVKAIQNYCEFEQFRRELMDRELKIATQEETQRILMKNLKDTQYAMTDLKINNHFLFNTLNSMASMALDGGQMPLYQSIVDLSKMFHYTLRTQSSQVPLEKEVEYVKAYLQLQKLRYGDDLKIIYKINKKAMDKLVPFNFLQPIVENAFVHGFVMGKKRKIRLEIVEKEGWINIRVNNSGKKLTEQACYAINQGICSGTSHGLSMIYQKLKAIFENECEFEIGMEKNGDTCFLIRFPAREVIL